MNTKHTPGPWTYGIDPADIDESRIIVTAHNGSSAICRISPNQTGKMANARLIATAPETLEMLKKLHEEYAHFGAGYWCGTGQAVERLIAKAEGGK